MGGVFRAAKLFFLSVFVFEKGYVKTFGAISRFTPKKRIITRLEGSAIKTRYKMGRKNSLNRGEIESGLTSLVGINKRAFGTV